MADIKIYGTLHNVTGEPIATADQVMDKEKKKSVKTRLDEIESLNNVSIKQCNINIEADPGDLYETIENANELSVFKGIWNDKKFDMYHEVVNDQHRFSWVGEDGMYEFLLYKESGVAYKKLSLMNMYN